MSTVNNKFFFGVILFLFLLCIGCDYGVNVIKSQKSPNKINQNRVSMDSNIILNLKKHNNKFTNKIDSSYIKLCEEWNLKGNEIIKILKFSDKLKVEDPLFHFAQHLPCYCEGVMKTGDAYDTFYINAGAWGYSTKNPLGFYIESAHNLKKLFIDTTYIWD